MLDEKIQEVLAVINMLPPKLSKKLDVVIFAFITILSKIHLLPDSWRSKAANAFAHNVLKVFKTFDKDNRRIREGIVRWTVELWDLEDDWMPGFSLDPPS